MFGAAMVGIFGRHGPTGIDFQGHDRKRGQYRRHLGRCMQEAAADLKRYFAEDSVLAVGAAGLFQHWDHSRVADWVVGVVAPAGADARNPRCTNLAHRREMTRTLLIRATDCRCGWTGPLPFLRAGQDALREVSLDVRAGEHLARSSGPTDQEKTTLMLILPAGHRRQAPWIVRARWV